MASAKSEARKYLGREDDYINLKGLNQERDIANQVYNTNATTFQNAYNDLLSTIAGNRNKARTDFGSGRSAISENAFMQNRQNTSDLASRGLNGGLSQLSKLGNRMETGRQYSNLANTFYNTMDELDATQRTGENEYNTNMETAKNTLSAALADINAREKAGRNAYRAQVAQLAEQIQARRDAAAAAAASLAWQRKQAKLQGKAAKEDEIKRLKAKLYEIAGEKPNEKQYKEAMKYYKNQMGGTDADAVKFLTSINIGKGSGGLYGPQLPWYTTSKGSGNLAKALYTQLYNKNRLSSLNTDLKNNLDDMLKRR